MMTKLFHEKNPVILFLGGLFDLMLLNLLTLVSGMIVISGKESLTGIVLGVLLILLGFVVAMVFFYAFPLLGRYENTILRTMTNAFSVAISHILQTGAMLSIAVVYAVLIWHHWQGMSAFLCLFGISVPGWLYMKLYLPVFRKME